MTTVLRVFLIVVSILCLFYILKKIRHSKLQIEYAIFWIVISVLFVVLALCPQIIYFITRKLGMISPANVVYLAVIAILLLKVFMMTIELSQLENKVKELVQKIALDEKDARDHIEK